MKTLMRCLLTLILLGNSAAVMATEPDNVIDCRWNTDSEGHPLLIIYGYSWENRDFLPYTTVTYKSYSKRDEALASCRKLRSTLWVEYYRPYTTFWGEKVQPCSLVQDVIPGTHVQSDPYPEVAASNPTDLIRNYVISLGGRPASKR